MSETKTGTVQRVGKPAEDKFGVQIDFDNNGTEWVNGWGSPPDLDEGTRVEVEYDLEEHEKHGIQRNLVDDKDSITVLEESGGSSGTDSGQGKSKRIIAGNAVNAASRMMDVEDQDDLAQFQNLVEHIEQKLREGEWPDPPNEDLLTQLAE